MVDFTVFGLSVETGPRENPSPSRMQVGPPRFYKRGLWQISTGSLCRNPTGPPRFYYIEIYTDMNIYIKYTPSMGEFSPPRGNNDSTITIIRLIKRNQIVGHENMRASNYQQSFYQYLIFFMMVVLVVVENIFRRKEGVI